MEDKSVLIKTIKKSFDDKLKAGITWFKFIAAINNIQLTKRELELLAYINYRGTISSTSSKDEFCRLFDSSFGTISNMTAKLTRLKLLVKEKGKTRINSALRVDFNQNFVVRFFIDVKKSEVKDGD